MISLTRVIRFPATHRMYRPDWTPEQNRSHFGPVAEYHGHEYACAVTVRGAMDPATGMVMDLAELDRILDVEVRARLSGRQLNTEVAEFAGGRPLPTCEALAALLFRQLASRLPPGVVLERVRVAEDETLFAECAGEG